MRDVSRVDAAQLPAGRGRSDRWQCRRLYVGHRRVVARRAFGRVQVDLPVLQFLVLDENGYLDELDADVEATNFANQGLNPEMVSP